MNSPFDNQTTKTISFELTPGGMTRTIQQTPLWGTDQQPRPVFYGKIRMPAGIEFPHNATHDRMRKHAQEMRELAQKVLACETSFPPMVCFSDGDGKLWAASNHNNLFAAMGTEGDFMLPVIAFDGSQSDAAAYANEQIKKYGRS